MQRDFGGGVGKTVRIVVLLVAWSVIVHVCLGTVGKEKHACVELRCERPCDHVHDVDTMERGCRLVLCDGG